MNHHAFDGLVQLEECAQRRIFQRLQLIVHGGLAVVVTVRDVLQEQIDFFVGDDVADVLRVAAQLAEGEAYHFVAGDRRAAAVAGVDGGIDLNTQARHRVVVGHELDARHDALGDGQRIAAGREPVGENRVLDLRQLAGARHGRVGVEKRRVVELQHGQVDAGCYRHHGGRQLVAFRIGLDLYLTGVEHHVSVGEDALALDHDAGGRRFGGRLLGPGLEGIRIAHGGENLHH